ncbi:MAG: TM2 domain-containing protein [Lachnospiraceae bacterium]|nr:TM2 domain-containing protein [Lachnospiraceae bacterium]
MDNQQKTKFCKYCGAKIPEDAVLCTACGRQVEELKRGGDQQAATPQIVINNANSNVNTNMNGGIVGMKACNKWVAFVLCLLLGYFGAHKFYEGKAGMGILYIFTVGLFGFGWIIDCISILCKPNPYYVKY